MLVEPTPGIFQSSHCCIGQFVSSTKHCDNIIVSPHSEPGSLARPRLLFSRPAPFAAEPNNGLTGSLPPRGPAPLPPPIPRASVRRYTNAALDMPENLGSLKKTSILRYCHLQSLCLTLGVGPLSMPSELTC